MWYYAKSGTKIGPISEEELRRLAENGELQPSDFVWRRGWEAWKTADDLGLICPPPLPTKSADPRTEPPPLPGKRENLENDSSSPAKTSREGALEKLIDGSLADSPPEAIRAVHKSGLRIVAYRRLMLLIGINFLLATILDSLSSAVEADIHPLTSALAYATGQNFPAAVCIGIASSAFTGRTKSIFRNLAVVFALLALGANLKSLYFLV